MVAPLFTETGGKIETLPGRPIPRAKAMHETSKTFFRDLFLGAIPTAPSIRINTAGRPVLIILIHDLLTAVSITAL